jgi:serralysin
VEQLTLTGNGNINATGNSLENLLTGNAGKNVLNGGTNNDTLTGAGGIDVFRFNTALGTNNVDRVTDFQVNVDKMQLENAIFNAIGASLTADEFVANTNGAAANGSQHILYDTTDGGLFYDADGIGGQAKTHFATLNAGLALDQLDFLVI